MARIHNFSGVSKTITLTTAQTITFPANEIAGAGVVAYNILFTGGVDIADVERIRILASGDRIMDIAPAQLRTWIEGTHRTGAVQATTALSLHLPLYLPDLLSMDERDACQFPVGAQPQVEIDIADTTPAGTAIISWTQTDVPPRFTSRLYSNIMNIPASANAARYSLADGGVVRGVILPTTGISRARVTLSDRDALRLPGEDFNTVAIGDAIIQTRMNEAPATIVDPFFIPISLGLPAAVGASYVELDTTDEWVGATNELGIWSVVPLAAQGA